MPPIVGIYNKYKDYIKGQTIIRLHGPDRSGIEKISGENWNKVYINRDEELTDIVTSSIQLSIFLILVSSFQILNKEEGILFFNNSICGSIINSFIRCI